MFQIIITKCPSIRVPLTVFEIIYSDMARIIVQVTNLKKITFKIPDKHKIHKTANSL